MISRQLSKWNIFLLILSVLVVLTTPLLPLGDSNEPTLQPLKAATSRQTSDHLHISSPWPIRTHNPATSDPRLTPTPPTSLSHPAPNSLSPRLLAGWTHYFVKTQFIVPVQDSARLVSQDINATLHRMIRYVRAIDARTPSSELVIGYSGLQMVFLSPRVLAWNFIASIIEYYLLLGTIIFTHFTLLWVKYASLAAVALAFYHRGNRLV
ncbi:MAG: hypothetical protein LQ345_000156 [Seirophora villosa]|nr:MAG: hypothetical protein LQ345_000156 [Seirophora villosa]